MEPGSRRGRSRSRSPAVREGCPGGAAGPTKLRSRIPIPMRGRARHGPRPDPRAPRGRGSRHFSTGRCGAGLGFREAAMDSMGHRPCRCRARCGRDRSILGARGPVYPPTVALRQEAKPGTVPRGLSTSLTRRTWPPVRTMRGSACDPSTIPAGSSSMNSRPTWFADPGAPSRRRPWSRRGTPSITCMRLGSRRSSGDGRCRKPTGTIASRMSGRMWSLGCNTSRTIRAAPASRPG